MIKINVLKKGDEVLSVTERFVAIKRKNGCVDIYNLYTNENNEIIVDPIVVTTIGYGEGSIEKMSEDGETTLIGF